MPTFRLAAAFLAGGVATAIAVVAMNLGRRSSDDTVHLWGRYWESRMGFDYALMAHKTAHATSQDAQRWADENDRCFQELVDRHILIPVHYDWRSKGETDEFRRVTTTFTTYRSGFSLEGGQWPEGIEYIDELSLPQFPTKFLTENRPALRQDQANDHQHSP